MSIIVQILSRIIKIPKLSHCYTDKSLAFVISKETRSEPNQSSEEKGACSAENSGRCWSTQAQYASSPHAQ